MRASALGLGGPSRICSLSAMSRGLGFHGVCRIEDSTRKAQMQDRGVRRDRPPPPVWSDVSHSS